MTDLAEIAKGQISSDNLCNIDRTGQTFRIHGRQESAHRIQEDANQLSQHTLRSMQNRNWQHNPNSSNQPQSRRTKHQGCLQESICRNVLKFRAQTELAPAASTKYDVLIELEGRERETL